MAAMAAASPVLGLVAGGTAAMRGGGLSGLLAGRLDSPCDVLASSGGCMASRRGILARCGSGGGGGLPPAAAAVDVLSDDAMRACCSSSMTMISPCSSCSTGRLLADDRLLPLLPP
uniref:Putative secreted protein n=1 Tax=Ixodes ricinus TaxID=34613 RepID=A0A6B0ULS3_IXORI